MWLRGGTNQYLQYAKDTFIADIIGNKIFQNNISEVHFETDNVSLVLPVQYTEEGLEEMLND